MKAAIKEQGRNLLGPLARSLAGLGVTPNVLTLLGLVTSILSGLLVAGGRFRLAAAALIAGSLCDVLDGSVARVTGRSSRQGAFLDSTVDRFSEMFFFGGLLYFFSRVEPSVTYALLVFFALGGSLMVSYTRARSEGLGVPCTVGLMERPERLVLLIVATLVGGVGIRIALWVLTLLVFWTSWQRIHHVMRETRGS